MTELDQSGAKTRTFVYQGSQVLAWQQKNGSTETMAWEHRDLSEASVRGDVTAELDPLGADAGLVKPLVWNPPDKEGLEIELRLYLSLGA